VADIGVHSAIDTDSTGRVPKAAVINALQSSGEASYDRARETLKDVSVDASGKVELEDWVEVRIVIPLNNAADKRKIRTAQCQAQATSSPSPSIQSGQSHSQRL
jgi:hypothetical protein